MTTAEDVLNVGGHRPPPAPESERGSEDTMTSMSERATPATDGAGPAERVRFALTPATMNIDQAAAYIGIAKSTLYTWRTRRPGFGPRAVKVGSALRYRRSDLDSWIEDHAETPDFETEESIASDNRGPGADQVTTSGRQSSMSRRTRPRHR